MKKINNIANESINTQKRWLNPSDLKVEYGFSNSWQAKARMSNSGSSLPFVKVGKFVKYDRVAIDKWLESHTIK